tara:strand:- start:36 stop:185 length:150 start_codon:yes stop_codon:yes gene_type:complete
VIQDLKGLVSSLNRKRIDETINLIDKLLENNANGEPERKKETTRNYNER